MVETGNAGSSAMAADEDEVRARLDLALARAGIVLAPDEVAAVRSQIVRSVMQTRALRAVPLANADEPEIIFIPFRGDDRDSQ